MDQLMLLLTCFGCGLLLLTNGQSIQQRQRCSDPLVKIKWAWLRGYTEEVQGVPVHHFLGIPYALPPVGPLRFKPSIPIGSTHLRHKGVFNATSFGVGCIQTLDDEAKHSTIPSSENCLLVNVYTPADLSHDRQLTRKIPVLVFIHGSGFVYGSSGNPHIYGGYLASLGDMVFVVFNYRLGALGLMYGHPTAMPGNAALWDQKAALEWVQENIEAFGGDPRRVTLMGHSAGATYSSMHLTSHQTRHLFNQAMVMSGIACERSGLDSPALALRKTREVAYKVGCLTAEGYNQTSQTRADDYLKDSEIECLMKVDPLDLANVQGPLESTESHRCSSPTFLPSYGNSFLPSSTDSSLEIHDQVHGKSILVGKVPIETLTVTNVTSWATAVTEIVSVLSKFTGNPNPAHLDTILNYYLGSIEDGDSFRLTGALIAAINDLCQHCPQLKFSRSLSTSNRIYQYYYTYVTEALRDDPARAYGPLHADDTKILFGLPFKDADAYTDQDRAMSRFMIQLWSHFVHKGTMDWPAVTTPQKVPKVDSIMYQYELNGNTKIKYNNINIDKDSIICSLLP